MKIPSFSSSLLIGALALALGACSTESSSSSSSSMPAANSMAAVPAPAAPAPMAAAPAPIPTTAPQATVVAAKVDFDSQVKPFFATYCFQCHGPTRQTRGIRFDTSAGLTAASDRITDVVGAIMPPQTAKQPTADEVAMIKQWIIEGAAISASYPAGG
jgi:uncharacterized membrane protein